MWGGCHTSGSENPIVECNETEGEKNKGFKKIPAFSFLSSLLRTRVSVSAAVSVSDLCFAECPQYARTHRQRKFVLQTISLIAGLHGKIKSTLSK